MLHRFAFSQDMHETQYDAFEVTIPFHNYAQENTLNVPYHTLYT